MMRQGTGKGILLPFREGESYTTARTTVPVSGLPLEPENAPVLCFVPPAGRAVQGSCGHEGLFDVGLLPSGNSCGDDQLPPGTSRICLHAGEWKKDGAGHAGNCYRYATRWRRRLSCGSRRNITTQIWRQSRTDHPDGTVGRRHERAAALPLPR